MRALPEDHKKGLRRRSLVRNGKEQFDKPAPTHDLSSSPSFLSPPLSPLECKSGTLILLQVITQTYTLYPDALLICSFIIHATGRKHAPLCRSQKIQVLLIKGTKHVSHIKTLLLNTYCKG
jgi:hypothetical protein